MRLTSLKVEKGQKPPAFIKFPNSNEKQLKHWTDILANAAEHLIETGKISAQNCPVKKSQKYILHTEPVHSTGKRFENKREIGELWVEMFWSSRKSVYNMACWLLENFGVNPSTVRVSTNRS